MLLRAGQRTDVGRVRSENQDSILVEPPLYPCDLPFRGEPIMHPERQVDQNDVR